MGLPSSIILTLAQCQLKQNIKLTRKLIMPMSVIRAINYIRMHNKKISKFTCIRMQISHFECDLFYFLTPISFKENIYSSTVNKILG